MVACPRRPAAIETKQHRQQPAHRVHAPEALTAQRAHAAAVLVVVVAHTSSDTPHCSTSVALSDAASPPRKTARTDSYEWFPLVPGTTRNRSPVGARAPRPVVPAGAPDRDPDSTAS